MAKNLLNLLQGQLSEGIVGKISSLIGANAGNAKSAIDSILPSIVKSITEKGSTAAGAQELLKLRDKNNLGSKLVDKLDNVLSDGDKARKLKSAGSDIAKVLLGDSNLDKLSKNSGLSKDQTADLYNYLSPLALSNVDKSYFGGGATSSSSSSHSSTSSSTGELIEGLSEDESAVMLWVIPLFLIGGYMLFFKWNPQPAVDAVPERTEVIQPVQTEKENVVAAPIKKNKVKKVRPGVQKKRAELAKGRNNAGAKTAATAATGAAAAAAGAGAIKKNTSARKLTIAANGNLVDQTGRIIAKAGDFKLDAQGNLVNNSGSMLAKAGTFAGKIPAGGVSSAKGYSVDANGNLVDANGKVVFKKGEFSEKDGFYVDSKGNKIGNILKAVGGAVAGAAGKTADFFKNTFGGMFKKKAAAVGQTYTLSQITFDPKSHRITNFSKNEVEGLAAALKAYPDSKIQVQVHADQSSKDRAQVVEDMLVTLGVDKKQISSKGMGDKNVALAKAGKVLIMVEK